MRHRSAEDVRIGLVGEFGVHNYGNEASLAAVLGMVRACPGWTPVVVADKGDVVTASYGVESVPLHHPSAPRGGLRGVVGKAYDAWAAWRTVSRLDAVVVPGTGVFEGLAIAPGGIPLTLFWYGLAARLLRRPFIVMSVGVDDAFHPVTARLFRWTLACATYLSVRDEGSARAARGLGVRRSLVVVPDLVLGSPVDDVPGPDGAVTVAVGVIEYRRLGTADTAADRSAYRGRLLHVVRRLAEAGVDVVVVGGALPDAPTVADVVARSASFGPGKVSAAEVGSIDDITRTFATCRAVVASRYHHLVAALRLGLPVVSLGYASKQDWLVEQFGLTDQAHRLDTFAPDDVVDQVLAALASPGDGDAARAVLAESRRLLADQAATVTAALGRRTASGASRGHVPERPGVTP